MRNIDKRNRICSLALSVAIVGAVGIAGTAGCAEERDPINRVQADALSKAFFVGNDFQSLDDDPEFYTRATLTDVGYGASGYNFTDSIAPISRIKWVITEDLLIGRIAYERIDGTDGNGYGARADEGVIVVAYPITNHFDISNAYNSATGEELNVVEENSVDRPWYAREFFRVDWSTNLNTNAYDFDTLSLIGLFGGVTYEPLAYHISDPSHEDAPFFDVEQGYFDVTNKAFVTPETIDLSSLGGDVIPACFLSSMITGGTAPAGNCNPTELTVKHSFLRVKPSDYEPVDWGDGWKFKAYGAFSTERFGYDRRYGLSDSKWLRFANLYNIWDRSHYYEEPDAMTGEVACTDGHVVGDERSCDEAIQALGLPQGSECDAFRERCTLPFRERTPKPFAWHYTVGSDMEYWEPTRDAAHQWDVAMRTAVQVAKRAECDDAGAANCENDYPMYAGQQQENDDALALAKEVDDCRAGLTHAEFGRDEGACATLADTIASARGYSAGVTAIAKMPELVVLCPSVVTEGDHEACGKPGTAARVGDLRHHTVSVIREPEIGSPWGFGPAGSDPLTGEVFASRLAVWSAPTDLYSQKLIDAMAFATGHLTSESVTDGSYVQNWPEATESTAALGFLPALSTDQVKSRVASFVGVPAGDVAERTPLSAATVVNLSEILSDLRQNVQASSTAGAPAANVIRTRRERAKDTDFEAQLLTDEMIKYAGAQELPAGELLVKLASPMRSASPTHARDLARWRDQALADRGVCMIDHAPATIALTDMSRALQDKFGSFANRDNAEKARRYLARRLHFGVVAHEMGHTMGLRHNFVSSSDALNYRPQYWQLRTRDGAVKGACGSSVDGENCVDKRYLDPVTADERENLLTMFMQSSVMDYAGEPLQNLAGLGAYDFAATRMFYGRKIAVYQSEDYAVGTDIGDGLLNKMDNFGGLIGIPAVVGDHYARMPEELERLGGPGAGLITNCWEVEDPAQFKPAAWNSDVDGAWDPLLDGGLVAPGGVVTRCADQPVAYTSWDKLRFATVSDGASSFSRAGPSVDPRGRLRVPYGFATDNWADLGNVSVYRHDNGADMYELADFLIGQQELWHIFDNYRRGQQSFSVRGASGRVLRNNLKLRDAAKGLGFLKNLYRDVALENGAPIDAVWAQVAPSFETNIVAAGAIFDHFARVMARPEPGLHCKLPGTNYLSSEADMYWQPSLGGCASVEIPNGATGAFGDVGIGGKPLESSYATDHGEHNTDYIMNAGAYYDKVTVPMLFAESEDNFVSSSRRDFLDARFRATSLADLFPDGYRRWLANNLTGDVFLKGPRLSASISGSPDVISSNGHLFPKLPIAWTSWWLDEPKSCFPHRGTTICSTPADGELDPEAPTASVAIDPQIGWEQQKFLIANTLLYLPMNEKTQWMDMMRIWQLGFEADPGIENRIEFHHPDGRIFVARTYGKEEIFGKVVQRGIAARVLEYANELLLSGYETADGPDVDGDGEPDWYLPVYGIDGRAVVINPGNGESGCGRNRACAALGDYASVPAFMAQTYATFGFSQPSERGVFDPSVRR